MNSAIPIYITLIILATAVSLPFILGALVRVGADRAGLPDGTRRSLVTRTTLGFALWGAVVLVATLTLPTPEFVTRIGITPLIPFAMVFGMGGAIVAFSRSQNFRRAVEAIPLPAVVAVQLYRAIGAIFLILLGLGVLPGYFAIPAGRGDVAVGVLAPLVALLLAYTPGIGRPLGLLWNIAGILDLAIAVGMGTEVLESLVTGTRVLGIPTLGTFPVVLVPAFAVPVSLLLHFVSLRQVVRSVNVATAVEAEAHA